VAGCLVCLAAAWLASAVLVLCACVCERAHWSASCPCHLLLMTVVELLPYEPCKQYRAAGAVVVVHW